MGVGYRYRVFALVGFVLFFFFFFQAEDGIRDDLVTGVQTCALPILSVFSATDNLENLKLHHIDYGPNMSL